MPTLLLRFAGPLQSWGNDSKFEVRQTHREPSKSAVVGLLAAALGRKRNESIDDLRALKIGIRVDREGTILRDYHVVAPKEKGRNASSLVKWSERIPFMIVPQPEDDRSKAWITARYYLADAVFLVGIESDNRNFLNELDYALRNPRFSLYLGRRSCPPEFPLVLSIRETALLETLKNEPWAISKAAFERWKKRGKEDLPHLRLITDSDANDMYAYVQNDLPLSFDPKHRQYGLRAMKEHGFVVPPDVAVAKTNHDPMAELE